MTHSPNRRILRITGEDAYKFLNDMVTNDLQKLDQGLVYAALLTPQGKYLVDFFLFHQNGDIHLDVSEGAADGLVQRLTMYKLRADVTIETTGLVLSRGLGGAPTGAYSDPRDPALGWRFYDPTALPDDGTDWTALRVAHCVPETGIELLANDSYILECGFERLNGVDYRKGCYVGQEVTARMKHKTELRKGLATVQIDGPIAEGSEITRDGKAVGTIHSSAGDRAIAYLRFDRMGDGVQADGIAVRSL